VALYTLLQNAAFLTSYDGAIYFHWHKQRRRDSLIHSAAAGRCERQFYMCTSHSHNTVCTLCTPCLRRKPFKRDLWLLKINWSIYTQNLQPSILIIHVLLHQSQTPGLTSFMTFNSPFPHISTAVCPIVTRGFSYPVDIIYSLLHPVQSMPLSTSCRLSVG